MAKSEKSPNFRDVPWTEEKVKVFKAVRAAGDHGATLEQIEKRSGVKKAHHYLYHMRPDAGGLVVPFKVEDDPARRFKLSAKGKGLNPDAELRKRTAGKQSAPKGKKAAPKKGGK